MQNWLCTDMRVFHTVVYQCIYVLAAEAHPSLLLAGLQNLFSVFLSSNKTSVEQILNKISVLLEKT